MANITITPIQSVLSLFRSQYPSGLDAQDVRNVLLSNTNILSDSNITEIVLSSSPFVGIGPSTQSRTYMVSVIAYKENGEPIVIPAGQISYNIDIFFEDDTGTQLDTTPPTIVAKSGTDIVIQTGQFFSAITFINTYFTVTDPQSGVSDLFLNPVIDFQSTRARASVQVIAVNGDGFSSSLTFFLTINLSASQTPPTITGPDFVTVFTDENMNNTKFIETKGYTITSVTGVSSITFSPSINWSVPATTITTITVVGGNNLTATKQTQVTVANRPVVDTEAPSVLQTISLITYFKSEFPTGVLASRITTDINASFIVTDANDFTTIIGPTVVDFTIVGTRTYTFKAIDEFLNESPTFTIQVQYLDDSDTVAPVISGPATLTFINSNNRTEIDVIANYTLSDNLDPDPQWFGLSPVIFNQIGTFNYLLRAIDNKGNIGSRTITVNVVADTVETDVIPPVASGPTSFTFRVSDNATVNTLIPFFTVTDNVSARENITFIATLGGSTIAGTYQFALGITTIVLRFQDEAENFSLPITIIVNVLANDVVLEINENPTALQDLTANHQYSAPIVSIIDGTSWKPISWLVDPVQTNYTIDGTMDEININFISKNLDTRLESGDLVRVVYDSKSTIRNTWGLPTYDNRNRPTNHDIMLVDNGQMVKIGSQDVYRHNYKLVELINILKDYRLPTLTFTSFDEVTITDSLTNTAKTFYQRPTNALSILQRAIRLVTPTTSQEFNNLTQTFRIVDGIYLQGEMIGVDSQFQEATLYDVVMEIGRSIGRTPVLYLNPNYSLTDLAKYLLFFETDREHSKELVSKTNLLANTSEYSESTVQDKGKREIVVDAHNVIGSRATFYPSDDLFTYATAVDQEALVVGINKQMAIVLPNNISVGEKVNYKTYQVTMETAVVSGDRVETGVIKTVTSGDLETLPLVKYNEWLVLDPDSRDVTAYYKENENIVYLPPDNDDLNSKAYFKREQDSLDQNVYDYVLFQVEYYPVMDFEARIGDGKSATFNQINPLADSETLGLQVYNYRKGNESGDITISKLAYSYDDILKPTQLINWDGEIYHITSVSFNSSKTGNGLAGVVYKVAYQLNKEVRRNFNLNAPTNQRDYRIPYENTFERYNVIKDKVKIHFTTNTKSETAPIISQFKYLRSLNDSVGFRYLLGSFETTNTYPTIETVAFNTRSTVATNPAFTTFENQNRYILTQVNKSIFGESLIINFQMPNNVYAGTKTILTANTDSERFQQRQVSYVDSFGKARFIDIKYLFQDITNDSDVVDLTRFFPESNASRYNAFTELFAYIFNWQIEKDSRESLNISLQIDFEGVNGTKIGANFLKGTSLYQARQWTTNPYSIVRLRNQFYEPNDTISSPDISGLIIPIDDINPLYQQGLQIILDDEYSFDTTSTYALVEKLSTTGIGFNYKVVAIMGDRSSLVVTDTLFIYY